MQQNILSLCCRFSLRHIEAGVLAESALSDPQASHPKPFPTPFQGQLNTISETAQHFFNLTG
jgi:hypothetical protein